MSQTKINLAPEQKALIQVIREKWKAIALLTERLDRKRMTEVIEAAYRTLNHSEPEIMFFDSPHAAVRFLGSQSQDALGKALMKEVHDQLIAQLNWQLEKWDRNNELQGQIDRIPSLPRCGLERRLKSELKCQRYRENPVCESIHSGVCLCAASQMDFCISVLNLIHDRDKWTAYQLLMSEGCCIFAFEKICLVCERPTQLSIDSEERLHAEAEPAIEFADGFFRKYIYHGVELPEKYGKLHPNQWQAKWLLEEKNAEVRKLLIQEIGYGRICQELQAIELDSWAEYSLLRIDRADVEPMYLLKMTCPSTGFIHALRVPPDISSAREAICWVNWGIEPEEFAVQS
jgi:hypothetical protein